jgi:hypothetical protein
LNERLAQGLAGFATMIYPKHHDVPARKHVGQQGPLEPEEMLKIISSEFDYAQTAPRFINGRLDVGLQQRCGGNAETPSRLSWTDAGT